MSIRLAIIGTGIMGTDHARIFAEEVPGTTVKVVCDADEQRARLLADAIGAEHVMTDSAAAIERDDVDAIVVASPDFTHAPLSLACIKVGKPVLCEKPLSQSVEECRAVIAAETAAGKKFIQLGFMRRFDQSYVEMKAALDEGRLGRALMMHNFHRNVETPAADFTGIMAITNSAPHEFDVVRHVLGCEYASISAHQPKRSDACVAPVVMLLETTDQQLVTIEINNNAAYGYDVRAELVGEAGTIAMNHVAHSRTDMRLSSATRYDADWRGRYHDAYLRQNRDFIRFVKTGEFSKIASDAWDGLAAARIAEAGAKALASGSKVQIEHEARPEFYRRG